MPVQTTAKSYVYFPDGCVVSIKASGDNDYTDVGAINSSVTATLEWDESSIETANAGTLARRIRNMRLTGGFTLINLNPAMLQKMSNGVLHTGSGATGQTVLTAGESSVEMTSYAMKLTHYTTVPNPTATPPVAGVFDRELELFAVYSDSGAFNFNFKGANEDGTEEMAVSFTAQLDTNKTDGEQLLKWTQTTVS